MDQLTLSFAIYSDWHIGAGVEGYADAIALKNSQGLPYIPGKAVKGLLKDAYLTALENAWFDDQLTLLFGTEGAIIATQGLLQVSSAELSQEEQAYFAQHAAAKKHLFKVIHFTAIDHKTGVALNSSLRSMEVCLPLTLYAHISLNTAHPAYQTALAKALITQIKTTAPLIHALGAKRHRGLGQVDVSVIEHRG